MDTRKLMMTGLAAGLLAGTAQAQQAKAFSAQAAYMVIDLSGGPEAKKYTVRYTGEPPNIKSDKCRTTELWLRLIQPGTFTMGSPDGEMRRGDNETQHQVTLTQPFYIGVFEVTQKQYELVMGKNPSGEKGDTRPVNKVSYSKLRGMSAGARWPADNSVDADTFFGKLRTRAAVLADLPTEAQWEYACRAGTTTALNSGKNLTDEKQCPNMAEVGRYILNGGWKGWGGKETRPFDNKGGYTEITKVGQYKPNAYGLYDMHGNVCEWCLDWYGSYGGNSAVTDPKGAASGNERMMRGGHWIDEAAWCRSARRNPHGPDHGDTGEGFRIAVLPGEIQGTVAEQVPTAVQVRAFPSQAAYLKIDLSDGPNAEKYPVHYMEEPPGLDSDACRTTELWLRRIQPGSFKMGSPAGETGRDGNETQHQVKLTQPYYLGVFEVTQRQYELVMGKNPSGEKGDTRPVEQVSYDMLRGMSSGARWPADNGVDADSFFGRLRARAALVADLPTEAQWEYACRAGTTAALNNGKNPSGKKLDPNMAEVGRYEQNSGWKGWDGKDPPRPFDNKGGHTLHTKVGMYKPNAYGLYDMHGNVTEWCLDWYGDYGTSSVTDPVGAASGNARIRRGGSWHDDARWYRSASRHDGRGPDNVDFADGFRAAVLGVLPGGRAAMAQPADASGKADEELAAACAPFKAVWEVYAANAERIRAEFQPKVDALQQQYRKALETLKGTIQRQGNLEKTKAVTAEIERFAEEKDVPPVPDAAGLAEIKALQANYAKPFAALEKERAAKLGALAQKYVQALEKLQADLVKADKLDDATAVSAARERAKRQLGN